MIAAKVSAKRYRLTFEDRLSRGSGAKEKSSCCRRAIGLCEPLKAGQGHVQRLRL